MSAFVAAIALQVWGQVPDTVGNRYLHAQGGPGVFQRPAWLSEPTFAYTHSQGFASISLASRSASNLRGYQVMIEAFYPVNEGEPGLFGDCSVVAALSGFTYHSSPPVSPGEGAVVGRAGRLNLGVANFAWEQNELTIRYPASLLHNKKPNYIRAYCVPESFDMTNVRGASLNGVAPIQLYATPEAEGREIEPSVPNTTRRATSSPAAQPDRPPPS